MKNKYESEHSAANTPNFILRTVLLFFSALYSGINGLVYVIVRLSEERGAIIWGIVLCAVFAGAAVLNIFDNRSGMKSLFAVIVWLVIYAGSVFAVFAATWTWLPVVPVAAAEVIIAAAVIMIMHKTKKL